MARFASVYSRFASARVPHRIVAAIIACLCLGSFAVRAPAQPVLITAPQTINPGATTITPTAGGTPVLLSTAQITVSGTTLTINGRHSIGSLTLQSSGTPSVAGRLTHSPVFAFDYSGGAGTDVVRGLDLTVAGNVVVGSGCAISAVGLGYPGDQGPGAGQRGLLHGGGGGHAGGGSMGRSDDGGNPAGGAPYGAWQSPADFGSGGAGDPDSIAAVPGGAGGGMITLRVPNGSISLTGTIDASGANAAAEGAGAGAGGSVVILCNSFSSTSINSLVLARGGTGFVPSSIRLGGGGGGGRIRIETVVTPIASFSNRVSATGGNGGRGWAGPGTVVLQQGATRPSLIIVNAGTGAATPLPASPIDANVTLGFGAILTAPAASSTLRVEVLGDLTTISGGGLSMSGRGWPATQGPGAGLTRESGGGGGGHGGSGGTGDARPTLGEPLIGGTCYGSWSQPVTLGSGGANDPNYADIIGGAGGGAIRLIVAGTFTHNSLLEANGANATLLTNPGSNVPFRGAGGGAGGSIWVTCGTIAGTGNIVASGGSNGNEQAASYGGGGGGGRIAIDYSSLSGTATLESRCQAYGAGPAIGGSFPSYRSGAAGSIHLRQGTSRPRLIFAAANRTAFAPTAFDAGAVVDADLVVRDFARIGSQRGVKTLDLTVNGDVLLESSGWIDMSGRGYEGGQGPGAGPSTTGGGSGGGHACLGFQLLPDRSVNRSYGDILSPTTPGSGGGYSLTAPLAQPGRGGGVIRLTVNGTLTNNSKIIARGMLRTGSTGEPEYNSGAGGSIWITAQTYQGSGTVDVGGEIGGSGGRIRLDYTNFAGTRESLVESLRAANATGTAIGTGGTLVIREGTQRPTVYIVDGSSGDQGVVLSGNVDLDADVVFTRQGILHPFSGTTPATLRVRGNMIFETGRIVGVGWGHPAGQGPGAGIAGVSSAGGGGHGGRGGNGRLVDVAATGGLSYGTSVAPVTIGSGGGGRPEIGFPGGAGGGALRLIVDGELRTPIIDMSGEAGSYDSLHSFAPGGGSGGSLDLSAGSITGRIRIFANGGQPKTNGGGGGGGGFIKLRSCSISPQGGPGESSFLAAQGGFGSYANYGPPGMPGSSGVLNLLDTSPSTWLEFQPPSQTSVAAGVNASISVGISPYFQSQTIDGITFTWQRRSPDGTFAALTGSDVGTRILGANSSRIRFEPSLPGDSGVYRCVLSTACGASPSLNASLVVAASACSRSDVAGANQYPWPDGQLTADDIIVFLGWFFARDLRADFAGPNQSTIPDNSFTADDIIVFLGLYFAGC